MDKLDGQIERIVFHDEESGFSVLKIKVRSSKSLVTLTGTIASVNEGEWLTADGSWFQDPKHGGNLKLQRLELIGRIHLKV